MNILFTIISVLIMLPGLIGVLLPVFPGIPYMWIVALVFGVTTQFAALTGFEFGILSIVAGVSIVVDYLSGALGARIGGASLRSLITGAIGLIIGSLILPPIGGIIGMFIGVFVSEGLRLKTYSQAARAALGGVLGVFTGSLINFCVGIAFIVLFLLYALS